MIGTETTMEQFVARTEARLSVRLRESYGDDFAPEVRSDMKLRTAVETD